MIDPKLISDSITYYQEKIKKFGGTAEGMDWKNQETQYLRFNIISRYIDFSKTPSVLDVGCGNGEFLNYCKEHSRKISYKGIDCVPEMVTLTNERFGNETARLEEFLNWKTSETFDYVIASGTFNAKLDATEESWREYFFSNITKMFSLAKKGIVFNCMTEFVDYRYDRLYYSSLKELGDFAVKNLSRKFIVDHSYPLYEMTMAVYKTDS